MGFRCCQKLEKLLIPFDDQREYEDAATFITLNHIEMFDSSCRIDATLAAGMLANSQGEGNSCQGQGRWQRPPRQSETAVDPHFDATSVQARAHATTLSTDLWTHSNDTDCNP